MIRATASAERVPSAVRSAPARRPALLILLLLTVLALVGTVVVGLRAAAAERSGDDIWVSADGVAFQRGDESDKLAYVVRPVAGQGGGKAFHRDLTREEQRSGWAPFQEARHAYPDGYCVMWVEIEDASNWHTSQHRTACTAARPTATSTPTPTPSAAPAEEPAPQQDPSPTAVPVEPRAQEQAAPQAPAAPDVPEPTPTPSASAPTPTPTPTPSATPSRSASASSSPRPSRSHTSPEAALVQSLRERQGDQAQAVSVDEEIISPLGWVAVLGSGAVLTAGGLLVLWRRLV